MATATPVASPTAAHGQYLLYYVAPASTEPGVVHNGEIWIVKPDGTGKTKIADGKAASWSHDGSTVHVVKTGPDCTPQLFDVQIGSAPVALSVTLAPGDTGFLWSPDDSQVVFLRNPALSANWCLGMGGMFWGPSNLMVVDVSGGAPRELLHAITPFTPYSWKPDSRHLVIARNVELETIGEYAPGPIDVMGVADGTFTSTGLTHRVYGALAASPDGLLVAYLEWDTEAASAQEPARVGVGILDGTADFNLGDGPSQAWVSAGSYMAWSPDGSTLAVTRVVVTGSTVTPHLVVTPPSGGASTDLYTDGGSYPSWSPDGSRIACLTWASGGGVLVVSADGSGATAVPGVGPRVEFVAWQP